MSSINVYLVLYKSPTSPHVAIYIPEISCAVLNMPCFSTLWYFCSLLPLLKMSKSALWIPPHPLRLNSNGTSQGRLSGWSWGEVRYAPQPPKDHHSSLLLWWCVSLSANLFCVEHVTTGPLYHLVTGPAWRGNSRESVHRKVNDYRTQRLCFLPMHISNTSSHSVLDNQRASPSRK